MKLLNMIMAWPKSSTEFNCYITGFVTRRISDFVQCSVWKDAINAHIIDSKLSIPEAGVVNCKTRGKLIHPNRNLSSRLLSAVGSFLAESINSVNVYEETVFHLLENYQFPFPFFNFI